MWYVRFGGDELGPFEYDELQEFLVQLGTLSDVEVRQGQHGLWSSIDLIEGLAQNLGGAHRDSIDALTQDDDKTLMSTDLTPEMLAEFQELLDGTPAPPIEDEEPVTDDLPATLDSSDAVRIPTSTATETATVSSDGDSELSISGALDLASMSDEDITSGEQMPATLGPMTDAMFIASPLHKKEVKLPTLPPPMPKPQLEERRLDSSKEDEDPIEVAPRTGSATLIPAQPKNVNIKNVETAQVSAPVFQSEPLVRQREHPFQLQPRKGVRISVVAAIVTILVGGIGAYLIWLSKRIDPAPIQKTSVPSNADEMSENGVIERPTVNEIKPTVAKDVMDMNMARTPDAEMGRDVPKGAHSAVQKQPQKKKPKKTVRQTHQGSTRFIAKKKTAQKTPAKKKRFTSRKRSEVLPRLDRATIESVMKKRHASLKQCTKAVGIKISAALIILRTGVVRKVDVVDRGKLGATDKSCVKKVLQTTKFPETKVPVGRFVIPIKL